MTFPKTTTLNYGPTISQDQFEDRVNILHTGAPPIPTPYQELKIRYGELNAAIDYKLGTQFPIDQRNKLWEIQKGLDRKRLLHVFKGFVTHPLRPSEALTKPQVRGFAKVLNGQDLQAFFEYSPSELDRLLK